MLSTDIKHLIPVDSGSDTPKYLQVSNGLIKAIEQRRLCKGDLLPSLRQLSDQLDISFDTAKKAYDVLKKRNIVVAAHGKSNVINATGPLPDYKIFLLFNELSAHKEILYHSFVNSFHAPAGIDMYVYNNNKELFRHLLKTRATGYTHHVIVPYVGEGMEAVAGYIDDFLKGKKIVLLHKRNNQLKSKYLSVYEDFENDIYTALEKAVDVLKKYNSLNIVFPSVHSYPAEIMNGFSKFCKSYGFDMSKRTGISGISAINKGDVFITLSDEDLANLIEQLRIRKLEPGKDVGIISYNETPLKQVLFDGITTISTDFKKMGTLAAAQVMGSSVQHVAVPIGLTLRPSL